MLQNKIGEMFKIFTTTIKFLVNFTKPFDIIQTV